MIGSGKFRFAVEATIPEAPATGVKPGKSDGCKKNMLGSLARESVAVGCGAWLVERSCFRQPVAREEADDTVAHAGVFNAGVDASHVVARYDAVRVLDPLI